MHIPNSNLYYASMGGGPICVQTIYGYVVNCKLDGRFIKADSYVYHYLEHCVKISWPFQTTGADFAGPLYIYGTHFGEIDHIAWNKHLRYGKKLATTLFLTKFKSLRNKNLPV